MPAIINSNQVYRAGECPIFVGYITDLNGEPITYNEVTSISVTHTQERDGIRNGIIVTSWFPVEAPDGRFEDIDIDKTNVLDKLISVNDLSVHVQNFNPALQQYNFLYIPFNGHRYYPNDGSYRTVFRLTLNNGQTDIITFESTASEVDSDDNPILHVESDVFNFGENIEFSGVLYVKYREPHLLPDETLNPDYGKVVFPNTKMSNGSLWMEGNVIEEVYLTVFDVQTAQRLIYREALGLDCIAVNDTTYDLDYTFSTNRLPIAGTYRFRFEISAKNEIIGSEINNVLCVFDIDVTVV